LRYRNGRIIIIIITITNADAVIITMTTKVCVYKQKLRGLKDIIVIVDKKILEHSCFIVH